jgi:hypothetical protein
VFKCGFIISGANLQDVLQEHHQEDALQFMVARQSNIQQPRRWVGTGHNLPDL